MKDGLVLSGIIILGVVVYQYFLSNRGGDEERSLRRRLNDEDFWYNKSLKEERQSEENSAYVPTVQAYPIRTPTCGHSLDSFFYYWCSEKDFAESGYENYHIFKRDWFYGVYSREDSDSPIFTPRMPGENIEYPSDEKALDLGRVDFIEGKSPCVLQEPVCFNPLCKACVSSKASRERFLRYYMHGYNSARNAVGL